MLAQTQGNDVVTNQAFHPNTGVAPSILAGTGASLADQTFTVVRRRGAAQRAELALAWACLPIRSVPSAASRTSVRRARTAAMRSGSVSLPPSAVTT